MEDKDEFVVDKVQRAVQKAVAAKKEAQDAFEEAIDTSSTFGYELGVIDERLRVLEILKENLCSDENCRNVVCSEYALTYRKVENGEG